MIRELKSGLFFFGLSLFVLWESLRVGLGNLHEPGSGLFSFWTGVILGGLSLVLIYRGWGRRESSRPIPRRVILALVFIFAYSMVLNTLGFIVSTFFLVGTLFRLGQKRSWWVLIGMSALVTFLTYLIFGIILHVYFPRSFLGI